MHAKCLVDAAALFAFTGPGFSRQTGLVSTDANFASTKTRPGVMQECQVSRGSSNCVVGGGESAGSAAGLASTTTRVQVMAELQQSREDRSYDLAHQEYEGQFPRRGDGNAGARSAQSRTGSNAN